MESTNKELKELVEKLQQKTEELAIKFNLLVDRLNNANIKSVVSFEDLEIDEDDDIDEEEDIEEEQIETKVPELKII